MLELRRAWVQIAEPTREASNSLGVAQAKWETLKTYNRGADSKLALEYFDAVFVWLAKSCNDIDALDNVSCPSQIFAQMVRLLTEAGLVENEKAALLLVGQQVLKLSQALKIENLIEFEGNISRGR